jgi:hypothetical protein
MEDDMGAICIHQCLLKLISRAVLTHCRCNTEKKLEFLMSDPEEAFEKKRPTLQRERVFSLRANVGRWFAREFGEDVR